MESIKNLSEMNPKKLKSVLIGGKKKCGVTG